MSVPSEANAKIASVIQRRRRAPVKQRLKSGRTAAVSGQLAPCRSSLAVVAAVWMVNCEVADELPGLTDAGKKVAVAPVGSPLAVRVTVPEKVPFCALMVIENCAVPPGCTVCGAVVELTVNVGVAIAAMPIPLRLADCGDPGALSDTSSVAA